MFSALRPTAPFRRPRTANDVVPGDAPVNREDIEPVASLPTKPFAFMWQLARERFLGRLAALGVLVAVGGAIDSLEPLVFRELVDGLTAAGRGEAVASDVIFWFVVLIAVWAGAPAMFRIYQLVDVYTSPSFRALAQKRMFAYLMGHSPRYFQDNFAGKLGQKVKQGGFATTGIIDILMFEVVRILVILAVGAWLFATAAPFYAIFLGIWVAAYLGLMYVLSKKCVAYSAAMSEERSTSSGKLIDAISNADLVRSFAKLKWERVFLGGFIDRERNASRRLRLFLTLMRTYQTIGWLLMAGPLVGFAVRDTLGGTMSVGEFTMVFSLVAIIGMNIWGLSNRMLEFFEQWGELTEALDLVTAPHEIIDPPAAPRLSVPRGAIEIRDLHFSFGDGSAVFRGLDLDIAAGEKVGLVGHSGAGKSTLVKLIRRQALPLKGTIRIDGQDVTQVDWESLNEAIAEVPQQPGVFHRTVRDNIRYAKPDASDADVMAAARDAHCHEFIMQRPTGYDTVVGEQGIKLSGGERQRVAIARALLKNAPILILDEATSALDSESEHLIQEALWKLMEGRTVIAIAHRLSTVTGMDRIVVLDQGQIVEMGSHADLLARDGHYARLWKRQVGGFIAAAE